MSKVHRAEKRKRALQPLAVNTFNANVHGRAAQRKDKDKDKDKGVSLAKRGQKPGKGDVADEATLAVDDERAGKKKGGGVMTVDPFDASTADEHVVAHTKKKPRTVTFATKVEVVAASAVSVNARGMGEGKPQSIQPQRQRQRDAEETPNTNAAQRR